MVLPQSPEVEGSIPANRALVITREQSVVPTGVVDARNTIYLADILRPRFVLGGLGVLLVFALGTQAVQGAINQAEQNRVSAWTQAINDALMDPTHHRVLERAQITSAGRNFDEKREMDRNQTPVNVRSGPGTREILGQVELNSLVYNVSVQDGWAGTYCGNMPGFRPAERVQIASDQLCAVDYNYVANVSR